MVSKRILFGSLLAIAGVLVAALSSTPALADREPYVQSPALYGDRVVFVSSGRLWTTTLGQPDGSVPVAEAVEHLQGSVSLPAFSPDGKRLAYSTTIGGNTDVYVADLSGGTPKRLTYHPDRDRCVGWSADGGTVLFRSARRHPLRRSELWRVSVEGGLPERVRLGPVSSAAAEPGGSRLAFTPGDIAEIPWKQYRGGAAPDLWVADLAEERFARITIDNANDLQPAWVAGRIYFVSDRSGQTDIFSVTPAGRDLRQVTGFEFHEANATHPENYPIRRLRADAGPDPRRLVFSQAGALAILDTATGEVRRPEIRIGAPPIPKSETVGLMDTLQGFDISPSGERIALSSRGRVFLLSAKGKSLPRQLPTDPSGEAWGVEFVGEEHLLVPMTRPDAEVVMLMSLDQAEPPKMLHEDPEHGLMFVTISPDLRYLAWLDKFGWLRIADLDSDEKWTVNTKPLASSITVRFSPDSRWLAFDAVYTREPAMVALHSLETRETHPVFDGLNQTGEPAWDPGGRYLFLLSMTEFEHYGDHTGAFVVQYADSLNLVPLESGTLPAAYGGKRAPALDPTRPFPVDPVGIGDRIYPFHWGIRSSTLETWSDGVCLNLTREKSLSEVDDEWWSYWPHPGQGIECGRFDARKSERVSDEASYFVVADRSGTVLFLHGQDGEKRLSVFDQKKGKATPLKKLDKFRFEVDPRAEWAAMLDQGWSAVRSYFVDQGRVGDAWARSRERYRALLPRIGSRDELNDLMNQMLDELGSSHTSAAAPPNPSETFGESVGLLGADLAVGASGEVEFSSFPRLGPWRPELVRKTLADADSGVLREDRIRSIDGEPLAGRNPLELLVGKADTAVELGLFRELEGGREFEVGFETFSGERTLRYADWVERNRDRARSRSEGRIGYVHIPDMDSLGLSRFDRQFHSQLDRDGIVLDVRGNNGGTIEWWMLNRLSKKPRVETVYRDGRAIHEPVGVFSGELLLLVDEETVSAGEHFAVNFRRMRLGPIVGRRTHGATLGTSAAYLLDMGRVRIAMTNHRWGENQFMPENRGVVPDIITDVTPEDDYAGRDPQLDLAIDELLSRLPDETATSVSPDPPRPNP